MRPRRFFRWPFARPAATRAEVDEEVRFHLDARAEQLMRGGMPEAEARAEAQRRFARLSASAPPLVDTARQRDRRMLLAERLDSLRQDVVFAVRSVRRHPTFSLAVLLTLAVAIGASTSVFAVTYAVVLRPLPFRDPARIVALENVSASFTPSGVTLRKSVAANPMIEVASLYITGGTAVVGETNPARATVSQATPRFFDVFGVTPILGRTFAPDEGDAGTNAVVVLSHGFWVRAFGADSSIVGRRIAANGHPLTVIGVMSAQFDFPQGTELWVPLPERFEFFNGSFGWETIARMRPAVKAEVLRASLSATFADQARKAGREYDDDLRVVSLQAELASSVRRILLTLLGAVAFVLLVACANVASLWGARGLARGRELAIRQSLGAGRGRLSRLIVVEATLLSSAGIVAGMVIAAVAQRVLVANAPASMPRVAEIGLHGPVLAFAAIVGLAAGLVCALLPLRRVSDAALNTSILGRPRTGSSAARATGGTSLITTEVALASLLTVGAGLLIRSYVNAERTSLGWRPDGVLTARVDLTSRDAVMASRDATLAELIGALSTIPGVRRVAATNDLPLVEKMLTGYRVALTDRSRPDSAWRPATNHAVTPGYFATVGTPVLRGRDFTAADRAGEQRVFIVNDSLRKRLVGDGEIVGRAIVVHQDTGLVVGIVGDVRQQGPERPARGQIYRPFAQSAETAIGLVVGTDNGDPAALAPLVRQTIARVTPSIAAYDVLPMERLTARVLAPRRFALGLLLSFAAIALVLTVIGVYGVVSYAVERRTRELGIRAALGARFGQLVAAALARNVLAAAGGVAIGLVAVVPLRSTIAHLLFGVSPLDPLTLVVVAASTLVVAVLASVLPGIRAARVDPTTVLRADG